MEVVVIVAVPTLYEYAGITETLGVHLPTHIVQLGSCKTSTGISKGVSRGISIRISTGISTCISRGIWMIPLLNTCSQNVYHTDGCSLVCMFV